MILLLQYTLIFASVLILVALGGCFAEHSGVINLGLEGIMIMGALGGALTMRYVPNTAPAIVMLLAVIVVSALVGMVYSCLLAVASINFKADQTLVGTALNLLGTAGATVIVKAINTAANPDDVSSIVQYGGAKSALLVSIGSFEFNWFMLVAFIALVFAYVTLYKTRFGLRLMACGEHPQAAASVGINVYKMRWAGVLISGVLGGIGGIVFITAGVSEWRFEYGVAGFGFLSLAVMIFGQWKPQRIALAALLFGFFRALGNVYTGFSFLKALNLPSSLYNMLPYIISLIVLAFTSKNSRAPKAEWKGTQLDYVAATNAYWQLISNRLARIRRINQLNDKMIAMTRFSATALLADYATDSVKMKEEEVFKIQINSLNIRLRMLLNNEMDAMLLPEPQATIARMYKNPVLMDSRDKDMRLGVIAFRKKSMADKRRQQQLKVFIDGYNAACDSINKKGLKHYASTIRKYYKIDDKTIDALPKMNF